MNETLIKKSFKTFLQGKDLEESSLSLDLFPAIFINYFREVKFEEVDEENDGDMLLFQYGIYDWGKGNFFELNFTRQLIELFPKENAHQMFQFGVSFYYDSGTFKGVSGLTKWNIDCKNLGEFKKIIIHSQGYRYALKEIPIKRESWVTLV